ncbi:lysophospholipid acyltransferase family protein [Candidatus Halobeggiatoa sp. HSG11]|nr:lysophospholipid acyltransferase family protein [Candidatus Halobeggiatoa sp. HSG11]
MFNRILRWLFFGLIVRPLTLIIIGLNIRHIELLPKNGPAILVANHNSHLDTLVLMSLFQLKQLPQIHPVAAADYFLSNRLLAWFALSIIGIVPLARKVQAHSDPFADAYTALSQGKILILFPEGTRGQPEQMNHFKNGIARLAKNSADVPITPIFLHGLGKSLPKGETILVPFFCDVFVGEPLRWEADKKHYMQKLDLAMNKLANEGNFSSWE